MTKGSGSEKDRISSFENATGTRFDDILVAGTTGSVLHGLADNDRLTGGTGVDHLFGGAGRDILQGQGGNDFLIGGADADLFRPEQSSNRTYSRVMDFDPYEDKVVFSRMNIYGETIYSGAGSMTYRNVGQDLVVEQGNIGIVIVGFAGQRPTDAQFVMSSAELSAFG